MSDAEHFEHPKALVESKAIGPRTRVWAFAHVLSGARIGSDCNICDHTFIENDVVVGDRVTVKCGVQLWDGVRIEDDVFIGPNVTFTNDPSPRSRQRLDEYPETLLKNGCSIGANATILPGISIGQQAMVGAGAVVTRSVPPRAVVVGNPARIVRYANDPDSAQPPLTPPTVEPEIKVRGVSLYPAPMIKDLRGNLLARELGAGLPFAPQRCFVVVDVPSKEVRVEHAHRQCERLLICLRGSMACVVDDGSRRQEVRLDSPEAALYLPPMVWGIQYMHTKNAVLLVLASDPYDPDDYIRDYDEFLAERRSADASSQ